MDSGVYDYYNSAHWRTYYKQTRAHNAITFDGGQGQSLGPTGLGEHTAAGRLTRFQQTPGYDISTGDATSAYAGLLSRAKRTLVFIRPSTLVTIDQLASVTARRYEYNLHTVAPLNGTAAAFRAVVAPAELCGTVASPEAMAMSASQGYYPAPSTPAGPHYWNKFSFSNARTSGLIVSVLRTDCLSTKPDISFSGSGATIAAGGRVITVTDADVTVQ
jgi:hypothetical protein